MLQYSCWKDYILNRFKNVSPTIILPDNLLQFFTTIVKIVDTNIFLNCLRKTNGNIITLFDLRDTLLFDYDVNFITAKVNYSRVTVPKMTTYSSNYLIEFLKYFVDHFVDRIHKELYKGARFERIIKYHNVQNAFYQSKFLKKIIEKNKINIE